MGLSNTLSPLLITPPSLGLLIVNITWSEQEGHPVGSLYVFGQLFHAQDARLHFSHLVEKEPRVKADRRAIISPLLMGELWPYKQNTEKWT